MLWKVLSILKNDEIGCLNVEYFFGDEVLVLYLLDARNTKGKQAG